MVFHTYSLGPRKISPVIIKRAYRNRKEKSIFVLMQVTRCPILLRGEYRDAYGFLDSHEMRFPGNSLMGHADVWIFQLKDNHSSIFKNLFDLLHSHNLTKRDFYGASIENYIQGSRDTKITDLDIVDLILNDEWIERKRSQLKHFCEDRWRFYPFETKFQIMKLINRRLITVYDLVFDDLAENILKKCSANLLVACIGKYSTMGF